MQPYQQQQHVTSGAVYASTYPPPQLPPPDGLGPPPPLRLARFPGDALHGPPGAPAPPGFMLAGPRPPYMATAPMQPFQPMMIAPQRPPVGYMPPQGFPQPHAPYLQPPMGHQLAAPMSRSGTVTPKAAAGSGATTPLHPMQRTLSAGQQLAAPLPPPAYLQPPGVPYLVAPPPGIKLPESLSPSSPGGLRPAAAAGSAPASRVQSAAHAAHGRAASLGGPAGPMEPLRQGGLQRAGSAGSTSGSLRSSLELGSLGGAGGGAPFQLGAPSIAGSRVGSAARKGSAAAAPSPELDEFDNIKVAVRVRPPNVQELARGDAQALFVNPNDFRQIQLAVPAGYSRNGVPATRNFTFHACLGPTSRQQDVLRLCGITQLLDASLDGYNSTVLAYGQTGSGKTFTMAGREDALLAEGYMGDSDDGIVARSLDYLFKQAARRSSSDGCRYSLRVSFAEIYNEQIYDLIRFDKKPLQVRWDATAGFHAPELLKKECASLEEALQVLSMAVRHRRVGSHELNMESSRSHSIFTAYIDCTPTRADDHEFGMTRYGKVSFVDLAGSERLRDSKSAGETLKETTNINRSLFMLGKVIAALADGAQGARVPYRESKLTKLLMDSLGGSSLSLLIACCSPSATHFEETLSTLSYASRAKNIRNRPAVQVDPEQAALAALKREVKLLRSENALLRDTVEQLLQEQRAGGAAMPAGMAPSLGQPPGTPSTASYAVLPPGPASFAMPGTGQGAGAASAGSRPATGPGSSAAAAASAGSPTPSPEDLMRRLLDTQRLLVQVSRANDRLASENGRLRTGKTLVANDYAGALEQIDWLKLKLEMLEAALLSGSLDSDLLAALDGSGSMSRAEVLEAARAAVQSAVLQSPDEAPQQSLPEEGSPKGGAALLLSLEPLASQLAFAAQAATAAATEAAVGGQAGQAKSDMPVGRISSGRASLQAEAAAGDALQAEVPQPTILSKPPLIDRLLISEAAEAPAVSATEACEAAAAAAEVSAAGVTATVWLAGSGAGKVPDAEAQQQAEQDGVVAGDSQS